MPIFNLKAREINCKIVYCGPGLGGKTTNIKTLYANLPNTSKSELQIIDTADDRTMFFDYFSIDLAKVKGMQTRFLCYAVPGQDYYKSTRKMVLQGVDGIVFVADSQANRLNDNIAAMADIKALLHEHGYDFETIPFVLQFNKRDLPNVASVEEMNAALNLRKWPTQEAIATDGTGVTESFRAICSQVIAKLNQS